MTKTTSNKKSAKAEIQEAAEAVETEAKDAARKGAAEARRTARDAAEGAADVADDAADKLRDAGRSFDPDPLVSQAADHIAANLSRAADAVRSTDFQGVHREVAGFARRNPLIFFGGAAALGFATARLLKSSDSAEPTASDDGANYAGSRGHVEEASWGYAK